MACKDSSSGKRKRVNLSLKQKLQLIEKLESGVSVSCICEEYGVKKQTVSDIRRSKEKLKNFSLAYSVDASTRGSTERKHMKVASDKKLEEAVYEWFLQQRSNGVHLRGVDLRSAADTLAKHMKIDFKASDGWLWRFRKRHGITNRRTFGGEKITAEVLSQEKEAEIEDEEEQNEAEAEEELVNKPKLSLISDCVDVIISYIDLSPDTEVQPYYAHFQSFREIILKRQQQQRTQLKLDPFFNRAPHHVSSSSQATSQPSTSRRSLGRIGSSSTE